MLPVTYVAVAPHVSDSALHDCVPADLSINLSDPICADRADAAKFYLPAIDISSSSTLLDSAYIAAYERRDRLLHSINVPLQVAILGVQTCLTDVAAAYPAIYSRDGGVAHYSSEQRDRLDRAEKLHCLAHISDDVLCEAVQNGEFRWANITPYDIRLNRQLRGRCASCLAGKLHNKSMPPSNTPPATHVGECLHFDLKTLLTKSPGGNHNSIRSVDEFSGDDQVTPSVSKSAVHIFDALMYVVLTRYNAHGHRVYRMVADSEPCLHPVIEMLAMHGILLTLVPPGQHAQRVERHIGYTDDCKLCVLYDLPYYLPALYDIFADRWVAEVGNGVPNSSSRPSTADILVTGSRRVCHYKFPGLTFGDVCMVQEFDAKRAAEAKKNDVPAANIPTAELGVCMGYSPEVPAAFIFLLANNSIVPRRVVGIVQVHPFNWRRKPVYHSELHLPLIHPIRSGQAVIQHSHSIPLSEVPSTSISFTGPGNVSSSADESLPLFIPPSASLPFVAELTSSPVSLSVESPISPISISSLPGTLDSVVSLDPPPVPVTVSEPVLVSIPISSSTLVAPPVQPLRVADTHLSRSGRSIRGPGFWHGSSAKLAIAPDEWITPRITVPLAIAKAAYLTDLSSYAPHEFLFPSTNLVSPTSLAVRGSSRYPQRRAKTPLCSSHTRSSDALTPDERVYLDSIIAANLSAYSSRYDGEWYDVSAGDDFSLADCNAILSSPSAFIARSHSSHLQPNPVVTCKELNLYRALHSFSYETLWRATNDHIGKQQKLGCLGEIVFTESTLPRGALIIGCQTLYKFKDDGRFTCRVAGRGDTLPIDPSVVNFAAVCPDGDKAFALAAMQAHAASRGEKLNLSAADVHDAFSQVKRPSGSVRLFVRFPKNFPHSLAGHCLEVLGALPGLTESNRLFDLELARVLIQEAGFQNDISSPRTFVKFHSTNSNYKCIISTHVDDMRILDNYPLLCQDALVALENRFGKLRVDCPSLTFTGVESQLLPDGSILQSQDRFVARLAQNIGVHHMSPVVLPAHADFFKRSISSEDMLFVDPSLYQSLTGSLVQVKTRDEIKHFVSHLCSRNASPDEGDYAKAIHLLRYLYSSPGLGRVFSATSVQIYCWADASFGNLTEGRSIGSFFLSVGPDNAPFVSVVKFLAVPTNPTDSEYMNTLAAAKLIKHYLYLSEFLGWPQAAVPMFLDSQTAINLAQAPQVSKKSLHIDVKYHYIRECSIEGSISLVHIPTEKQRCNVITKYLPGKTPFLVGREILLNTKSLNRTL